MHILVLGNLYNKENEIKKESTIASELLESITTPFSGDSPFGENINYDPDFDVLKAEIGKLGNTDYDLIEEKSQGLLKEKSKDIRVLSFLSFAFLRKENWENFADIFDGLAQLSEQNYDSLFPERPRAKQMAFKWLSEQRYVDLLESKKPDETVYGHTKRLVDSLEKIKKILEEKFPDGSPFPSRLFSAAQKWEKTTKPKPKPAPAPEAPADAAAAPPGGEGDQATPAQPAPSAQTAATPDAATAAPRVPRGPMENIKDAQANGRKIAQFLIEKEPEKPMGYRLMRIMRWDGIEKAPPAESGKIRIEGPPEQRKTFLKNCTGSGDWKKLLASAEKDFSSGPTLYWIDLQRMSATACKNLGDPYKSIHEAICMETALFLKRIPEIKELCYSDGSPFCDEATKDWIDSEVTPMLSSGSAAGGGGSGDDPLKKERKEINELVSAGKTDQAVEILQGKIHESGSERINFKRSLMLCNLLFSAKHADIAQAILESLHEKITAYNLERWEPDLAVEAWCLLVKAYKMTAKSKPQNMQIAIQEKQNSILSKISCIDPKSALKLNT